MKGVTRKILLPLVAAHAVAILLLLLYNIIAGDKAILAEFAWSWIFQAVLVSWMDFFIPITITGFLLGLSVFINNAELRSLLKGERSFVRITGKTVVLVLLISVMFVILNAFVYGSARQQRDTLHDRSVRAHAFLLEAQDLAKRGLFSESAVSVRKALLLAPNYLAAAEMQVRLSEKSGESSSGGHAESKHIGKENEDSMDPKERIRSSLIYEDNLKLAREYFERSDYYSALYFIRKAEGLTERVDDALVDLRTEVEMQIRKKGVSAKDHAAKKLSETKQKAVVDYLQNGRPIEAYHELIRVEALARGEEGAEAEHAIVEELTAAIDSLIINQADVGKEYDPRELVLPGRPFVDPDFCRWMPEVLAQLERTTFFREEAETLRAEASGSGVMFVNREEDGIREYLYAAAVLEGRFNQYLVAPEIIVVGKAGKVVSHRVSAYGKIVGSNLMLKSIGRLEPERIEEVRVLEGEVPQDTRNVVRLHQSPEVIRSLSLSRFGYQDMSVPELFSLISVVPSAGYDVVPLQTVLLGYLLQVLSLPSLCFFAIAWGWANRSRYLTWPVLLTGLMVVALPVLVFILMKLYQYIGNCLNASILMMGGFENSLVVLVVIQTVQLVASLVYLAGQTTD
jgi:tetratricopeptide (TPR) repeat protein